MKIQNHIGRKRTRGSVQEVGRRAKSERVLSETRKLDVSKLDPSRVNRLRLKSIRPPTPSHLCTDLPSFLTTKKRSQQLH